MKKNDQVSNETDGKAGLPAWFLMATALLCGGLIMVIEVLGSRVIGPFFGVSLFVWSSLIAVTMIALAAGYAAGGVLADRRDHPDYLYGIILLAGVLVLAIPFVKGWTLRACMPLGLRLGAFTSSLVLFGPPLLLLGCVSPYIIRIAAREIRSIGRTVGSFYAISTIGSVAGTVLTGFVLILYVGVSQIFFLVGGLLVLLGAAYFVFFRRKWPVAAAALLPLLLFALPGRGLTSVTLPSGTVATVVFNKDTYYGNIKVVDYRYGLKHTRELLVDGTIQTGVDMANRMSVYPFTYLLGIVPYSIHPEGRSCLVVGLGGGVVPRWFEERGVQTDVVDIDPHVVQLAGEYFGFRASGVTATEDARYFLAKSAKRYDYIVMDVFSGESAPAHVVSLEALRTVNDRLAGNGVLTINFIGQLGGDDHMTASVVKTLRQVFANVEIFPSFDPTKGAGIGNMVLVAYHGPPRPLPADLVDRFPVHPLALKEVHDQYRWRFVMPERAKAVVLTDDYNPIDCYDNRVKEFIRRNVLEGTAWEILIGSSGCGTSGSTSQGVKQEAGLVSWILG